MRSTDNFDPRLFLNDACGDAARHCKRRNVMRGHGIGRKEGAAPDDDTLRNRRVCRDPRPLANANRREIAWAEPVGSIDRGVVSGDQHGVRSELHLVLQDDSSPGMQPAACREEDIAADFHAIGKVDGHMPRNLKILPAALKGRPQQESAQLEDRPQIGQPACGNGDEMEPEILEHSHFPALTLAELPLSPRGHLRSVRESPWR
jgi:hypothetical protein